MKEAFDLIRKKLRVKKDNLAHNLQLFKDKKMGDMVSVCESKLDAYIDALSIVSEVEAEYGNGWIPCSERLPEIGKVVLAQYYYHHPEEGDFCPVFSAFLRDDEYWQIEIGGGCDKDSVIAWRELPEPWKGEK